MFEQTFKNINDILHKDAGCTSELDYTEQSSWLLFAYLASLKQRASGPNTFEYKIGESVIASSPPLTNPSNHSSTRPSAAGSER